MFIGLLLALDLAMLGYLHNVRTGSLVYNLAHNYLLPAALPLQRAVEDWAGERNSLAALRGLWALLHGFVALELTGKFQRGGDLSADFDHSIRAYVRGLRRA